MSIDQTDHECQVSIMVTTDNSSYLTPPVVHYDNRRNTTANCDEVKELVVHHSSRQPTSGVVAIHRPSVMIAQRKLIMDLFSSHNGSTRSLNAPVNVLRENHIAHVQSMKNRRLGK
jgi:hypothetical protein